PRPITSASTRTRAPTPGPSSQMSPPLEITSKAIGSTNAKTTSSVSTRSVGSRRSSRQPAFASRQPELARGSPAYGRSSCSQAPMLPLSAAWAEPERSVGRKGRRHLVADRRSLMALEGVGVLLPDVVQRVLQVGREGDREEEVDDDRDPAADRVPAGNLG